MLVNELVGYKSNPIYQKAKSTFVKKSNKTSQLGRLPKRTQQIKEFTSELEKYGFKQIGSGMFSAVFKKAGYPWLFKIFHRDPAYLEFLKWAILHQDNPHVPKIKGKLIKINEDTYAVRMEPLRKLILGNNLRLTKMYYTLEKYIGSHDPLSSNDKIWLKQNFPKMIELIEALQKSKYHIDIHSGNMMMRGGIPVIIDPLCDYNSLD